VAETQAPCEVCFNRTKVLTPCVLSVFLRHKEVIENKTDSVLRSVLILRNITKNDFGEYECVGRNEIGDEKQSFYLRGKVVDTTLFLKR
jgi:hypothetical protein